MPYPATTDPDYCPGSRTIIDNYDDEKQWHTCPVCERPISAMGNTGCFFPHVRNKARARLRDDVQETLIAAGCNRRRQ